MNNKIMWEINITPLTDVFMVLLVIFMITGPILIQRGGVDVKLPASSHQEELDYKGIVITLTKDKEIYINDERIKDKELFTEKLEMALAIAEEKTVIIKGDREALFGDAVSIMDLSKTLGAERIAVLTELGTPTLFLKEEENINILE